jgi:uncharacterized FlaG/YvyC family protein|tara:strand:+ start:64 stop:252 length:189 start_codon:yes stop_codon:yes gene_type:complete
MKYSEVKIAKKVLKQCREECNDTALNTTSDDPQQIYEDNAKMISEIDAVIEELDRHLSYLKD